MRYKSKICAIIPTYNRADMIEACIDSLLAQSRPVDQIIVVNDGSTDDTAEVLAGYGSRITLVNKENGGKASALNLAFSHCHGDYVWICDDDDIALPDAAACLASALDADMSLDIAFGRYQMFVEENGKQHFLETTYWAREEEPNYKICFLEGLFTHQFAMLVRHGLYKKVGLFNEALLRSQDFEMTLRLTRSAKMCYVPEIIYLYRQHFGVRGTAEFNFSEGQSRRKWYEFDNEIMRAVFEAYELEEFTPSFAIQWPEGQRKRAALIQRAIIIAKRGLWEEAVVDLEQGLSTSDVDISLEEINLCEAIIHERTPWLGLSQKKTVLKKLRACYMSSNRGRDLILALCRPPVWMVKGSLKSRDVKGFVAYMRLLLNILGFVGLCRRLRLSST